MILSVDPMSWSTETHRDRSSISHDVLLSVAKDGELAFWIPELTADTVTWRCTSRVKTGRDDIRMAACSSAKKSVLSKLD